VSSSSLGALHESMAASGIARARPGSAMTRLSILAFDATAYYLGVAARMERAPVPALVQDVCRGLPGSQYPLRSAQMSAKSAKPLSKELFSLP
jgi:hypothetical protein